MFSKKNMLSNYRLLSKCHTGEKMDTNVDQKQEFLKVSTELNKPLRSLMITEKQVKKTESNRLIQQNKAQRNGN